MTQRFLSIAGTFIVSVAFLLVTGCKEETIIKAKVAPGDNDFGVVSVGDTMACITKTVFLDKFKSSEKLVGLPVVQALGTIVDPYFGKTNAGVYFQVLPTVNDFTFSASGYTLDSAVLILPYSGFAWGNRTNPKPQKFRVYRVNEPMNVATDYYSNEDRQVRNELLGEATINLESAMKDTPVVAGNNAGFKHLRIPLSQAFLDDVRSKIGTGTFSNESNFLAEYNGFYVAPDSTANMNNNTDLLTYILFDGGSDYARVAVAFYYREDGSNETKTAFFNYNRDKTAVYNRISRNFIGYPAQSIIDRYNSTINVSDDTVLLQNEPGCVIDVRIPNLGSIPTASILKAELVFTRIKTGLAVDSLSEPNRITPVGIDATGAEYEIADYSGSDVTATVLFVDGTKRIEKDAAGNDISTYRINIPREVQKAINAKRNELHLRIKGTKGFPAAYRLVAGGRTHGTYRMQLNLVYSQPD